MRSHADAMPPVHPDLSRPKAVHVRDVAGGEYLVVVGRGGSLLLDRRPEGWVDLDLAHARVRDGSLGPGYVVSFPTRRWSAMRIQHVLHPRFRVDVTVYT